MGGGPGVVNWGGLGGSTCPQGQALVNHGLPLSPLALPLTIHLQQVGSAMPPMLI